MTDSIRYQMYYSKKLLKKIDKIKEEKGFIYRSQAVIFLITLGLERICNE
jgi:metal-responsive CopG/Arc/MetJ family transcriptional regulator